MNDIFKVMKFTMKDMVTRKSFIISTIIILVMIVVGFNIPNIVKSVKGSDSKTNIIIVDKENIYEDNLKLLDSFDLNYEYTFLNDDIDTIKDKIVNDKYAFAIIIDKVDGNLFKYTYVAENIMMSGGMPEDLEHALTDLYKSIQVSKLKLSDDEIKSISPVFQLEAMEAGEEVKGNILAMMMLSIVLFYAIFFCAYQVSSSITTEKTSKIIETLVTSTSPRNIVLGKTIGVGVVGLCQVFTFALVAIICAKIFMPSEILSMLLDTSTITPLLGVITLLYFILGYLVFSLLYALTGSTVSKPEDIQSANSPVAIVSVAGFYLAYFSMMNPYSGINVFATLFPFSSPFCMPFRIMMDLASTKDVLLSLGILIVTILLIAKITIKIYSNAILNYGSKISFKDLIKIYKQK